MYFFCKIVLTIPINPTLEFLYLSYEMDIIIASNAFCANKTI